MTSPSRATAAIAATGVGSQQERGVDAVVPRVDRGDRLGGGLRVARRPRRRRPRHRRRAAARARRRAATTSRRAQRPRRPPAGTARRRRAGRVRQRAAVARPEPEPALAAGRQPGRVELGAERVGGRRPARRRTARRPGSSRPAAVAVVEAAHEAMGRQHGQRLAGRGEEAASAGSRTPDPPRTSGSSAARRGSAGPSRSDGGRRRW